MKHANQRALAQRITSARTINRKSITLKSRELRLMLQMLRNTPAENHQLRRQCALQRQYMRSLMSAARRFSRRVAREPIEVQQEIRQIQNAPFYDERGALSALMHSCILYMPSKNDG